MIDADLDSGVIKQRIAKNAGKSKEYRSIVIFKKDYKSFFVHGFAKNEKSNVTKEE